MPRCDVARSDAEVERLLTGSRLFAVGRSRRGDDRVARGSTHERPRWSRPIVGDWRRLSLAGSASAWPGSSPSRRRDRARAPGGRSAADAVARRRSCRWRWPSRGVLVARRRPAHRPRARRHATVTVETDSRARAVADSGGRRRLSLSHRAVHPVPRVGRDSRSRSTRCSRRSSSVWSTSAGTTCGRR